MPVPTTLILDGIFGRGGRFGMLLRSISRLCGPAELFPYDTTGRTPFETLGAQLAAEVRRRGEVNLIGFSMGGLVIRAAHQADPSLPVRRAVFLNSPHNGSMLAYCLARPAVRQMRPGSNFLRRLSAQPWPIPTLAIWCPCDLSVIPGSSARWTQAHQRLCCHVPLHVWPLFSPSLHRHIAAFLRGEAAAAAAEVAA